MYSRKTNSRKLQRIVQEQFGFEDLRPGQKEAIRSVIAGRDTLAVLPTGSGKSMIYQLSSLVLSGPTIIVSPLIALQRDQVESLEKLHIGEAAQVNSTMKEDQREAVFEEFVEQELEFLFLAPEQLKSEEVL